MVPLEPGSVLRKEFSLPHQQNGLALVLEHLASPNQTEHWRFHMAAASIPDWDQLPDDSKFVYEALAQLGWDDFSTLPTADMSLVLALALHLERTQGRPEMES